jgi:hypothetical protein
VTGHCYSSVDQDVIRIALRSGTTVLAVTDIVAAAANLATAFTLIYYETAATSTTSYKVSVIRASGSGNCFFFADATRKAYLTLEDMGT